MQLVNATQNARGFENLKPGWVGVWAMVIFMLANAVFAQPEAAPDFAATLESLASEDHAARSQATDTLLADDAWTVDKLAAMYAQATTLEQRHRIRWAARHHALVAMRKEKFDGQGGGSLGVVHAVQFFESPVENEAAARGYAQVIRVLPGFPAAGLLHPGDRITAINNKPVVGNVDRNSFEIMLKSHLPGQEVLLTVERGSQTLELAVTLAGNVALLEMYGRPDVSLTDPFLLEWQTVRDLQFPDP